MLELKLFYIVQMCVSMFWKMNYMRTPSVKKVMSKQTLHVQNL